VTPRLISPWRIASVAVVLGLLGSAIVTLALVDSPAQPAAGRRPGSGGAPAPTLRVGQAIEAPQALRAGQAFRAAQGPAVQAGLRMLHAAAAACQDVSYRGLQIVAWWGGSGASTSLVEVWHQPGRGTLAKDADNVADPPALVPSGLTSGQSPDGVLGVSGQLLVLMQANYQVVYTGDGKADNRSAHIVEVRRPGGELAARFWLDVATSLPLRRELFDASARVISEDAFINLTVGAGGLADMPAAAASPWTGKLDAAGLAALRAGGWPLPDQLPGGLTLFAADHTATQSGEVVDLSYSDGLSVMSLFVQQGVLPPQLPGWRLVSMQGRAVYAADSDDRSLTWSAGGYEFTLIADAPQETVGQVLAALPSDARPGFWQRLGRGFRRIISWANPFR
jgi:MucB/RseB N-terminal domain